MSKATYDESLSRLLVHEGGYTNHPSDPGGPTNFGITIFDYRKYVKPDATAADIKTMKLEEAKTIYRAKYWDAQRCDELPAGVDFAIFDYGVNSGIGRSGKVLRRVLGLPDNTSVVNDEVIAAANGTDAKSLISDICDERLRFLKALKTWPVFGGGWGRRVVEVKAAALHMMDGTPGASTYIAPASGRGIDPDKHARNMKLQQSLLDAGFDPGAIDGDLGPKTIKAFQKSRGLTPDGVIGPKTQPLLDAALKATGG